MASFLSKILNYMANRDYEIYDRERHYNIIYVEGVNWDGTVNADRLDEWNDRRLLIEFVKGTPHIIGNWTATTEPGRWYTLNPMNQGARRGSLSVNIELGVWVFTVRDKAGTKR